MNLELIINRIIKHRLAIKDIIRGVTKNLKSTKLHSLYAFAFSITPLKCLLSHIQKIQII